MKQRQHRLTTQPTELPSFDKSWTSLKLQLLTELQRLARECQMTLVEMQEWMLTQTADLTQMEQIWMKQTCRLVSVMPPLPSPPRDLLGVTSHPSTLTLLNQEVPSLPFMSTPSTTPHLLSLDNLTRQIFPLGQLPMLNFASQYQRVVKPPFVATLMVPPSDPMRLGIVAGPLATSLHQTSHLDSYGIRDSTSSRSPSPTMMGSPNTPI